MVAIPRWLAATVFMCLIVASGTRAAAQGLSQDVAQELYDMQRLNYDRSRLNYDLNNGNILGAIADEIRIGFDQQRVQRDEMQLEYDLSRQPYPLLPRPAQALVPHPQYPGYYYYPSNPAQLYYYPNQPPQPIQTGPPAIPPSAGAAQVQRNALPSSVSPANTATAPALTVMIRNQDSSGLTINYAVNGTPYSTPNGSAQRLDVPPKAQIVFDRGGEFGEARYTLRSGVYDFQVTDRGWELYKQRPIPPSATAEEPGVASAPARNAVSGRTNSVPPPPPTPASVDGKQR
ncbi:MAG: hypothetical protein P4L84_18270 [Isosphaeraceae bacterium]|nr:hypothetical protein [Isosphaeraceae bacterium]